MGILRRIRSDRRDGHTQGEAARDPGTHRDSHDASCQGLRRDARPAETLAGLPEIADARIRPTGRTSS
jgi:hypothetical protein